MERTQRISLIFIFSGLTSGLLTLRSMGPEVDTVDAGQSELAVVFILVMSLGFIVTGAGWFRDSSEHPGVPALFLGAVGVIGTVGGFVVFRPWQYTGLAGGLRSTLTGVFAVIGGGLVLSSIYWFRQREDRFPLAVLAGLLAVGLFYVAHQQLDLLIAIPILTLIVAVLVAGPIIAVLYRLEPRSVER